MISMKGGAAEVSMHLNNVRIVELTLADPELNREFWFGF
jgi:hypothetical protein